MNQNNRGYTAYQNPQATKEQKAEWDRMVRELENRGECGERDELLCKLYHQRRSR